MDENFTHLVMKVLCVLLAVFLSGSGAAMDFNITNNPLSQVLADQEKESEADKPGKFKGKTSDEDNSTEVGKAENMSKENENSSSSTGFNRSRLSEDEEKAYQAGYSDGSEIGYSLGRQEASRSKEIFDTKASPRAPEENLEINDYTFTFGEIDGEYTGLSWPDNDTIKLEISRLETANELETMCDHEVAHQLFPEFEHPKDENESKEDPIYKYSDDMEIKSCDILAKRLSA